MICAIWKVNGSRLKISKEKYYILSGFLIDRIRHIGETKVIYQYTNVKTNIHKRKGRYESKYMSVNAFIHLHI